TLKSEKLAYMKMLMGCKPELQRQYINTVARYLKGYRTLEPNAVKVARSVLKGLGVGNDLRLLNISSVHRKGRKERAPPQPAVHLRLRLKLRSTKRRIAK
ncbi:MAG: hypothetical protein Q8N79_07735, partial [Candidatus Methanoperedens sp.]|nr:hypothetical protein [Candidatus Methanoperedens sp.]